MNQNEGGDELSTWLDYQPEEVIRILIHDIRGFVGFTQDLAQLISSIPEAKAIKLMDSTLPDLLSSLIKKGDSLGNTLDIIAKYAELLNKGNINDRIE